MSIAKVIEVTAESTDSYDSAVLSGIEQASKSVDNVQNAWVKNHEVILSGDGQKTHRVNMKVTFVVDQS